MQLEQDSEVAVIPAGNQTAPPSNSKKMNRNGRVNGSTDEELVLGLSQSSSTGRGGIIDDDDGNIIHHGSHVAEQEHSATSSFNALLSKFGGGRNVKKQHVNSADEKALSQSRFSRKKMSFSSNKPSENDAPHFPVRKEISNSSFPGKKRCQQTKLLKSQLTHQTNPKSLLILEQLAAHYFLSDTKKCNNNATYGARRDGMADTDLSTGTAANEETNSNSQSKASSGSQCSRNNQERVALISFLDINNDGEHNEAARTSKQRDMEHSQDIQQETNIDAILEMASNHLSLGKNELALTAYRRAMKCAFEDVISVKKKLVEVKEHPLTNTTAKELTFELSLLQVASRVADIHNNMGVVHEMNHDYEKAKSSYVDALEVYHNTCKRFEEKGDSDVDRTLKNVERMAGACASEQERKRLHDKARRTAKRVEREQHFARRKTLLREAIGTLRTALELEGSTIGLSHPVAASTLIQIGKYHYEILEYNEAAKEIQRATLILRNALGKKHPRVGKSTLLLASIYERHGESVSPEGNKYNFELELCVDALEPLKATLGQVSSELAFLYVKIAHLYDMKGDVTLSLLAYKAALRAFGEQSLAVMPAAGIIVVSVWVRVVEHLTSLRSWDETLVAGKHLLRQLRHSKNALFQVSAPRNSISSQTPSPAATQSYKTSHIEITSDTYYDALFTTLQCLGQAHTSLSNYALARDACSESLQIALETALLSHQNIGSSANNELQTKSSVLHVIRALKRLGKIYLLEKHYDHALECFLPSLELLRSSEATDLSVDCASVLGSLGFLYLKLNKYTESRNFFRECLRLYQQNGVDTKNDRETRKVLTWLEVAESREEEFAEVTMVPPAILEIPTIVFHNETE